MKQTFTGINERVVKFKHIPNKFSCLPILKKAIKSPEKAPKASIIRQAFLDVSMVNKHRGLSLIAKEAGINVDELKPGEFLLFLNANRTQAAMYGAMGVLTYIAHPRKHRISSLILKNLPEIFKGEAFDYDKELKPFLETFLKVGRRKKPTV